MKHGVDETVFSAQNLDFKAYMKQVQKSMCFEILGFDILIDEKLKPWLIEINHAPSFATDTPLDFKIKKDLVADTLQLLNMNFQKKKK